MSNMIFYIILALPFVFRGLHGLKTSSRVEADRKRGWISVLTWFIAYIALLGLAALAISKNIWTARFFVAYAAIWIGILLRLAALLELKECYSEFLAVKEDHKVIDTGPYQFFRHPLHIGLMLEYAGLVTIAWSAISTTIFVVCLYIFFIRNYREEEFLKCELGEPYQSYMKQAHCLIDLLPRSWLAKLSNRAGFD